MTDPVPPKQPALPKQLQLFGEYVVDALVEEGPTWALYRALHIANEKQRFRVRVLQGVDATRRQVVEAFARMAILLDSLKHEGIIPVSTAGVDQGLVFVINAEVPGITLEQRMTKGPTPLEPSEVVRIVREIASVLDYLHQHEPPIIHHTLEPSKILLSQPNGSVKVLEVGYAHAVDEVARVEPVPHAPEASDQYRAPEDVPGAMPRAEIDQFALARIAKVCLESRKSPALEAALRASESVIARGMSTDPAARYPSAGAFANAFADAIEQAATRANAPTEHHAAAPPAAPTSAGVPRKRLPTPPAIFAGRTNAVAPAMRKGTIIGTPGAPPPSKATPPLPGDLNAASKPQPSTAAGSASPAPSLPGAPDASGPPKKISGSLPVPRPSSTSSSSLKAVSPGSATSTFKGLGSPLAPAPLTPAGATSTPSSESAAAAHASSSAQTQEAAAPASASSAVHATPALATSSAPNEIASTAHTTTNPAAPPPLPKSTASQPAEKPAADDVPAVLAPPATPNDPFADVPVETISMVPLDEFDKSQVTSVSSPDHELLAQAFPSDPPVPEGVITKEMPSAVIETLQEIATPSDLGEPRQDLDDKSVPAAFGGSSAAVAASPRAEPQRARPVSVPPSTNASQSTAKLPPVKRPASAGVRIATILGVSIVLASVVYTAGFVLREPLTQLAAQRGFHVATANPQDHAHAQANTTSNAGLEPPLGNGLAVPDAAAATIAPPSVADASPSPVVVANDDRGATSPGVGDAGARTVEHDAGTNDHAIEPVNPTPAVTADAALPRRPSNAAQDQAENAIEQRIAACNGHLGHHAYIHVVYDGATGQPSLVEFTGHTLDGNPLTTCLEAAVRAVSLPPFREAHWETRYTFMIR
jgi:serine/threonine-protein kinase